MWKSFFHVEETYMLSVEWNGEQTIVFTESLCCVNKACDIKMIYIWYA